VYNGDSCKRVPNIVARDSSIFKNGYIGGNVEGISSGGNGSGGVATEKNHEGLFGECRCRVPGMLGGRELGKHLSVV